MKVVLTCNGTRRYYGAAKYFYFLAKYLVKEGIDVEVIVDSDEGRKKLTEICRNVRGTVIGPATSGKMNTLTSALYSLNLARYLKDSSFDILHSYSTMPLFYLALSNRAPTVFQVFGNEGFTEPEALKARSLSKIYYHSLVQPAWRYCAARANAIAAEGEFQIEDIAKTCRVSRDKIVVLPIGVYSTFIKERLKARGITRKQLGLTEDSFVLLSVSNLYAIKGISYLIDAFRLVKQKLAEVKLIIIGAGPEEQSMYSQIRAYQLTDSIIHLKNVPEVTLYDYYAISDLYVSPILQRDFIMGILEAEVCGLPIVSTGQGWLIRQGESGYVVPPRDPVAMAEAVLKVYDGDRKTMGVMSRKIAKGYDFELTTKETIKLYQNLLAE